MSNDGPKITRQEVEYFKLLHRLFVDNDDGEELLKIWEQRTFYEPGIEKDELDREIFIREGQKRFLRQILCDIFRWKTLAPTLKKEDIVDANEYQHLMREAMIKPILS